MGKYVELQDAYISITESLKHAAVQNETEIDIRWINAEKIEDDTADFTEIFKGVDGILVPGGFGDRGIEGKIASVQYAREHKIPFFGICLGMQCAVIEFARHCCGIAGADSSEFRSDVPAVIDLMPDQVDEMCIRDRSGSLLFRFLGLRKKLRIFPGGLSYLLAAVPLSAPYWEPSVSLWPACLLYTSGGAVRSNFSACCRFASA